MTKIKSILVIVGVFLCLPGLVVAETLTMTTYYPSPFGVYQSLRLAPNSSPPGCSASTEGTLYVDASGDLQFCNGTSYSQSIGEWETSSTNLFPKSFSTLDVGIGTNAPDTKLHVASSASDFTSIRVQNTDSTNSNWEIRSHATSPTDGLTIWGGDDGNEATHFAITSAGNVGIGTIAPSSDFTVTGDIELSDDLIFAGANPEIDVTGGDLAIDPNSGLDVHIDLDTGSQFYVFDAANTSHIFTVLQATQRIGVLNAAPTSEFDVNGTVTAVAYLYSSDANLKDDFKPVKGLDGIMQLEGLSYQWKKDGSKDIGVTAQDVEQVYPELVHTDETSGQKYVKYGNLIAPMIEAIKEQQSIIEHQNEQIDFLKSEIDQIKKTLSE